MALETERKYLSPDLPALRRRLREAGAVCGGAHFEGNDVFDRPEGGFADAGFLLRLRTQERPEGRRHILTLKLPAAADGPFKEREERECAVGDAAAMRSILEGLGFILRARYEKIREEWRMPGATVALDSLPFGEFAEIEGAEEAILAAESRLGLDMNEKSTESYHRLHQEWLRERGLPRELSFVFPQEEAERLRRALGIPDASGEEQR